MIIGSGKSVLQGIAYGKIYLYQKKNLDITVRKITDVEGEINRLETAFAAADKQLEVLYAKSLEEAGQEQADIFKVHRMILADELCKNTVISAIADMQVNAEYAVYMTGEKFAGIFASAENDYLHARAEDVKDISWRVIRNLTGAYDGEIDFETPVILLTEELSPSELIRLDKSKLLGIVTKNGSVNSHTAILARSMNIPALVQADIVLKEEYNGKTAAVDGIHGIIYIEPKDELLEKLQKEKEKADRNSEELGQLIGLDNITADGRRIDILANIGSVDEIEEVLRADAGGIGLLRSEFIFLGKDDYPSEDEQFDIYKEVFSRMEGRPVIIRTLDIGADKRTSYMDIPEEENPAMGCRAIRFCLNRPAVFKKQLRAIYRAAVYGNAAVLFPMITSVKEVRRIKELVEEIKAELVREGILYGDVDLGIMIETPAAALISDLLAKEVDFFSLGTNDLTQYTLAVDRQNQSLEEVFDSHHEAVIRLVQMTVENAHKAGIRVGICGELAADVTLTKMFVDIGVDELSMSPAYVLQVRKAVRSI